MKKNMQKTIFEITKMACLSKKSLIRTKLDDNPERKYES